MSEVLFRRALPSDREAMLTLCSRVSPDGDYIPDVWDEWLAHQHGQFTAVLDGGRLIGLGKFTRLFDNGNDQEWWLEGLRLDPDYHGRGIGRKMHEYNVDLWRNSGGAGTLRLLTESGNSAVHRLCQNSGMRRIAEWTAWQADAVENPDAAGEFSTADRFTETVFEIAVGCNAARALGGTIAVDSGWRWATLRRERMTEYVEREMVWLWRGGEGLLVVERNSGGNGMIDAPHLHVLLAAGADGSMAQLYSGARSLAGAVGFAAVGALAAVGNSLFEESLSVAGYRHDWPHAFAMFEVTQ